MDANLKFLAAGLAIGAGAIATAWVQSKIGPAAVGALVEKKDLAGLMIVLLALPETMVILGFVVAILIIYA